MPEVIYPLPTSEEWGVGAVLASGAAALPCAIGAWTIAVQQFGSSVIMPLLPTFIGVGVFVGLAFTITGVVMACRHG